MARFYPHNAKELKPEDATAYEQAEARGWMWEGAEAFD
jgi:hypothetical protein